MAISDEEKKIVITRLMEILASIESKEYQRRVWIKGLGPEASDFDETYMFFVDDCDFVTENYKEFGISETQCQLLVKFRGIFEHFSDDNDWPPFFIDTPEWNRITKMAEEVLQAFNYKERRR